MAPHDDNGEDSKELTHVRSYWSKMSSTSPIYAFLFPDITFTTASPGFLLARLLVSDNHLNTKSTLHGSVSATIVDYMGGLSIATYGLDSTGVSVDIHVSYVSAAKVGDMLEIEGRTTKMGATLAYTTVVIYKLKEGGERTVVVQGSHTKYVKR